MKMACCDTVSLRLVVWFVVGGLAVCVGPNEPVGRDEGSLPQRGAFVVEVQPLVAGPSDARQWEAWREGLYAERRRMRERLGYDGET